MSCEKNYAVRGRSKQVGHTRGEAVAYQAANAFRYNNRIGFRNQPTRITRDWRCFLCSGEDYVSHQVAVLVLGGLLSCCLLGYATLVLADTSAENGDRVVSARLKTVVRQYREPAEESILALEQALRDARQLLGEGHYASGMLEQLQKQVDRAETPAVRHRLLREGLTRVQESLAFRPILETKLPSGYPAPTPLHQIEVKQLPACRLRVSRWIDRAGLGKIHRSTACSITSSGTTLR